MTLLQREDEGDEKALATLAVNVNFSDQYALYMEQTFKERSQVICCELAVGLATGLPLAGPCL